jgi:hypothetical protein
MTNEHLEKAKAALTKASEIAPDLDEVATRSYTRLLDVATVQAFVAQAEALERIALQLEPSKERPGDWED